MLPQTKKEFSADIYRFSLCDERLVNNQDESNRTKNYSFRNRAKA